MPACVDPDVCRLTLRSNKSALCTRTALAVRSGPRASQLLCVCFAWCDLSSVSVCLSVCVPTGRPVLALELPHVSQRWVLWVPTVDEVAEVLLSILNRNDISSCCLVGHSYGSAVASRLLQQAPERIQQLCLIDPICFAMYMPTLLRNFMYEWPGSGSLLGDFMMISAARDLHVSATLSRRFFWSGERGTAWAAGRSLSAWHPAGVAEVQ